MSGYGKYPYGSSSYGSLGFSGVSGPTIASAVSLDGFRIEVTFSEEMDVMDADLVLPGSYTLSPTVGGPSIVQSVVIGTMGVVGALSVILTHTGTLLGGTYEVSASGPTSVSGQPILPASVSFYTLGEVPSATVAPISATEVLIDWEQDMLLPAGGSTIDQVSNYDLSHPSYPIPTNLTGVTFPYGGDNSQAVLTLENQTNHEYILVVGPGDAILYDGSVLPDADPSFTGTEVNPSNGTSNVVGGSYLSLSRTASTSYGWSFEDTTGRLVTGTTFRVDLTFDASAASYTPGLSTLASPVVGVLTIEDSVPAAGVQVKVFLQRDGADSDEIRVLSGAFDSTYSVNWSVGGQHTISVLRNTKANIYTILFDGQVVVSTATANFTESASEIGGPGASWILADEPTTIAGFRVHDLSITATATIFSSAWNFLHSYTSLFIGSTLGAQKFLLTERGPLTKGWGDATPATEQDVSVTVNGTPVVVEDVNPYVGRVELEIAVPTSTPPPTVLVDYTWMASPVMSLAGLNTEGLVLNKWDRVGAFPTGPRFPMAVSLGPDLSVPTPIQIGHKYLGFEREYSALFNSPTTLVLNQNPHKTAVPGMERATKDLSVTYEGVQVPTASDPVWDLSGTDTGQVNINQGTYTVADANSGSYNPNDTQAVIYSREEDIAFSLGEISRDIPSAVNVVGRFAISDDSLLAPDGVFTGVGFGFHDSRRLYLVGALRVNGVSHVGLLLDATKPHVVGSWEIGPCVSGTILSSNTIKVTSANIPPGLVVGDRFQILPPDTQAGVYAVSAVVHQADGYSVLTVDTDFPADFRLYGNTYPTLYFEVPWEDDPLTLGAVENQTTYRLVADPDRGLVQVLISGGVSGVVISPSVTSIPLPSETSLLIPSITDSGLFFWGSLSRQATSRSTWSFYRYGVIPDVTAERDQLITVEADMESLPEDETDEWSLVESFGYSEVDSTGSTLLLKSTSSHPNLPFKFGYTRIEPFITPETNLDLRSVFRIDSGVGSSKDVGVEITDTRKQALLKTLLYREDISQSPYRALLEMPSIGFSGILTPDDQGFQLVSSTGTFNTSNHQQLYRVSASESLGVAGSYWVQDQEDFDSQIGTALWTDSLDRVVETRFAVPSYTAAGSGDVGDVLRVGVGGFGVSVRLIEGVTPSIRLTDWAGVVVQDFAHDWTDGSLHTYRILTDFTADTLVLVIDDVVQIPTVTLSSFGVVADNTLYFGVLLADVSQSLVVDFDSVSYLVQPPDDAKRTLGVYLGGDATDINNWEIPRTDSTTALNSDQVGPVIQDMDWRSDLDVRMYRDPNWGVTVYRPDMALPPYFSPETFPPTSGTGFATETAEPSAGWINVEYGDLPDSDSVFGSVSFGSLDADSVTQQRWSSVRYRLHRHPTEDYIAPQHMVLNEFNTIHSGELTRDVTPEQVVVQPSSSTQVSLIPTHLYADRVFKVLEEGKDPLNSGMFTFDEYSQIITLLPDEEGTPRRLGVIQTGELGAFSAQSVTFTDSGANFSGVVPGYVLHINSGLSTGSYMVTSVVDSTTLTVATAFSYSSVGGVPWQITQTPPPVTVVFSPGSPVTNTYLGAQPLLESVTLLNEGTPPIPKSQTSVYTPVVVHDGGTRDLSADTPVDVLADDWRVLSFEDAAGTYYESMEFTEVDDGGTTGLITSICEGLLGVGDSGLLLDGGDPIYSPTGGGASFGGVGASANLFDTGTTVGSPAGGMVLDFGPYHEFGVGTPRNALGGIPNPVSFVASGNGYVGPQINQVGTKIAILEPINKPGQPGGTVTVLLKDTTSLVVEQWVFNG